MSDNLMTVSVVRGSVAQVARQNGRSLAETFIGVDTVILFDCSGSMEQHDSRGGRSRYDVACSELVSIQNDHPGKLALISFATHAIFCPGGVPFPDGGTTHLERALKFAKVADVGGIRFIVISDGVPDYPEEALSLARQFVGRIDAVYVGPENDREGGRAFLDKLVKANGRNGVSVVADRAKELATKIEAFLIEAPTQ